MVIALRHVRPAESAQDVICLTSLLICCNAWFEVGAVGERCRCDCALAMGRTSNDGRYVVPVPVSVPVVVPVEEVDD